MLGYAPCYAYSCNPKDVLLQRQRQTGLFFFGDVQAKGAYPKTKLKAYERQGVHLELTEEDILLPFSAEKGNGKDELISLLNQACER